MKSILKFNPQPNILTTNWLHWLEKITLSTVIVLLNTMTVKAAEKIYFIYSPLKLSLQVSSLEAFAEDGSINKDLGFYINIVDATDAEKEKFRKALVTPIQVDPVVLARLLNTDMGERLIDDFGEILNIEGGKNGKYIIRGAMIQAAFEPEGLTLLNFLENISTDIQFEVKNVMNLSRYFKLIVKAGEAYTNYVAQLSQAEANKADKIDFSQLDNPGERGSLKFKKETWNLIDQERNRKFYVNVYQPEINPNSQVPVVIISHGLASTPEDFASYAEHLASYGYVVALPQHPGSDKKQAEALKQGYSSEYFLLNEFIDRPLDISYVIDELERRNATEFGGSLDLNNVGVFGHSFGGYTALAVAGATIDFKYLDEDCTYLRTLEMFNTSLLLQCQALKLDQKLYNFRDERVKAIFVLNPVMAAIFGYEGIGKINIPIFVGAGTLDPATPFVFEQARGFRYLKEPEMYLMLEEGEAHVDFSQIDGGMNKLHKLFPTLQLPPPDLLHYYTDSMLLSFFNVYIANQPEYLNYLQSSYLIYLSQNQKFKSYLITRDSHATLEHQVNQFLKENLSQELRKFPDEKERLEED